MINNNAFIFGSILVSLCFALIIGRFILTLSQKNTEEHFVKRLGCVDGVRGYLALFVCIHHFVIYYWDTSSWGQLPKSVIHNMGQTGVAIFFMITGFLFFHRILINRDIDWRRFFISRIFRIYPLYVFSVLIMVFIAIQVKGYNFDASIISWLESLFKWTVFVGDEINGFNASSVNLGVQWTLKYEWLFYLILPILSFAIISSRLLTWVFVFLVIILAIYPMDLLLYTGFYMLFLVGGIAAYLSLRGFNAGSSELLNGYWVALLGVSALLVQITSFHSAYGFIQTLLLAVFFIPLALGNDYFGLLKIKASVFLGKISYSIYLLHGVIFYIFYSQLFPRLLDEIFPASFTIYLSISIFLVICISWATYSVIEAPSQEYGRRLQRSLAIGWRC